MVPDPLTLTAAKELNEVVGIISRLVGKLRAQPDIAAVKLAVALTEVRKTYQVVDEAIAMYVSLAIDHEALAANSKQLVSLSGGSLNVHVKEGKGHCGEIDRIRVEHLDRWFERALNQHDARQMDLAFDRLSGADEDLFDGLIRVADQLTTDTAALVDLAMEGREDEARKHIRTTYLAFRDLQRAIAQGTLQLVELQDQFMDIAATR